MPTNSLEQEAMERVRRMYSTYGRPRPEERSAPEHRAPEQRSPEPQPEPKPRGGPHHEPHSPKPQAEVHSHEPHSPEPGSPENGEKRGSILDLLLKDKDESLILLLLVLLMKDGADMNLMLALVYMLL